MGESTSFCEMGNIQIHKKEIWTTGLNTCIFLCIKTKKCYIGWHFNYCNTRGVNMNRIKFILDSIKKNEFIEGYIIPGEDRNKDLSLKPNCKTMKMNKQTNPFESRNYFLYILKKYKWYKKISHKNPVKSYKHFIMLDKDGLKKAQNDNLFNENCILDAGK